MMGTRGFLTLGMLLALAGNLSVMIWWSINTSGESVRDVLLISAVTTTVTFLALIAIWSTGIAVQSGLLSRSGVIGLHLGAMAAFFFTGLPAAAFPPMLVLLASMLIAFARFVRTPLPDRA